MSDARMQFAEFESEAKERIDKQVQNEFARRQREAVLRQQVKALKVTDAQLQAMLQRFKVNGLDDEARRTLADFFPRETLSASLVRAAVKALLRSRESSPGAPTSSATRTMIGSSMPRMASLSIPNLRASSSTLERRNAARSPPS